MNALEDDQAEVKIAALMTLSSPLIPARLMPATKGDEPAPEPPLVRPGSLEGQMMPMARMEPM